jgi:uncharacterized protein (TIGR00730 family)
MTTPVTRVCVFCGSSRGNRPVYAETARELGTLLGQRGIGLVYGGGHVGLMGYVAAAALAAGAHVTCIISEQLNIAERGHPGLAAMHIERSMHDRKARMALMSDGFIALPGGFGTLEELCEMITWTQLTIHDKPCIAVNVDGYFDPLFAQFERGFERGFVREEHRMVVSQVATPAAALDAIAAWEPGRNRNPFAIVRDHDR